MYANFQITSRHEEANMPRFRQSGKNESSFFLVIDIGEPTINNISLAFVCLFFIHVTPFEKKKIKQTRRRDTFIDWNIFTPEKRQISRRLRRTESVYFVARLSLFFGCCRDLSVLPFPHLIIFVVRHHRFEVFACVSVCSISRFVYSKRTWQKLCMHITVFWGALEKRRVEKKTDC